jgi:hypothetical protein
MATVEYIDWYNNRRLHGELGHSRNLPDHDEQSFSKIPSTTVRGHRVVVAGELCEVAVLDAKTGVVERVVPDNNPGPASDNGAFGPRRRRVDIRRHVPVGQ